MDASVWTKIIMAICAFGTIAYTILKDKLSNKKMILRILEAFFVEEKLSEVVRSTCKT